MFEWLHHTDPCEDVRCPSNQECMLIGGLGKCMCSPGFTGGVNGGCVDIDECLSKPCAAGAVCRNEPGKFDCECPSGWQGEPYKEGCREVATSPPGCSPTNPCPNGEECATDGAGKSGVCICSRGLVRDVQTGLCRDINECLESPVDKPACGFRATCKNLPGSYECSCPSGFYGNPYSSCDECDSIECRCQLPYRVIGGTCLLSDCADGKQTCPSGAECISVTGGVSYCACPAGFRIQPDGSCQDVNECAEDAQACAFGAECLNRPGRFDCVCPEGLTGDPYKGGCSPSQQRCVADSECSTNEKCVQPGECICPPPFYTDTQDGNRCKSPCERFPCGVNSKCTPTDPPKCMCEPGHTGNPILGCTDIDECRDNPCAPGAQCVNENGGFKCRCPTGQLGDPYQTGCQPSQTEARSPECSSDSQCDGQLACIQGSCVNPCQALPCGPNAYCEPEDHAAWCRCLPSFKESSTGACVSLCEGVLCGENAQCVASGSEGTTCACLEGYNGNPFAGGVCIPDVCSASNPCQEPQVCVSGRCKERCEGVTCGVGARCDKATNKCVCLPFFIGKPELLCVPPVVPPVCQPGCGVHAHCEYGAPNRCVCDPGTSGNPYELCGGAQERHSCDATKCGANAECQQGVNRVDCVCPVGFQGNPYVGCEDVNECMGNACGANAVCLNTPGSYDCQCQQGFQGNPFMMCMPIVSPPRVPVDLDACAAVVCGPNAACSNGACVCLAGYLGDDPAQKGCLLSSCRNDLDCTTSEICFQVNPVSVADGGRHCVDACTRVQCGPNAACLADNHRPSCVCQKGFSGNADDLKVGCQAEEVRDRCATDGDCPGTAVCHSDINGVKKCVDPCAETSCGQNEICRVTQPGKPQCECEANYVRNTAGSGLCEKPSLPDCVRDADCRSGDYACRPDALGVRKCVPVCNGFTCPPNSDCKANNHVGQCVCRAGFTGNANDRNGCRAGPSNQCESDAQCREWEACQTGRCVAVCESVYCGKNAICAAKNHAAKCQCPAGLYAGDPTSDAGCRKVECLTNSDCSPSTSCHKPDNKCIPVCVSNSCGRNAICLAENHMAMCSCPAGFEPNPHPEIECVAADLCTSLPAPCHSTAACQMQAGKAVCACPTNTIGDPYGLIGGGCRANGTCPNGDNDCPSEAACDADSGRCVDPCDGFCGPNSVCRCTLHRPICSCPAGFGPDPKLPLGKGCIRLPQACRADSDCAGGACLGGECRVVCRAGQDCAQGEQCVDSVCVMLCLSHAQCAAGQACTAAGTCSLGCRTNTDCPANQACLNNKCESPCQREGICGVNSDCDVVGRSAQCRCRAGFAAAPTAQQGCMRETVSCAGGATCPTGSKCSPSDQRCYPACSDNGNCASGERCIAGQCIKTCYSDNNCLAGEVCIDGGCRSGCRSDADCSAETQVCVNSQCLCGIGYVAGPQGSCVDIDECQKKPCHSSANCVNSAGSFRCVCPLGKVGDAYAAPGCTMPNLCESDTDCSDSLSCVVGKNGAKACADPCASKSCGPNALCTVANHRPSCSCPTNHRGDANDLTLGCFRVDCTKNDDCPLDRACDQQTFKCFNPCDQLDCFNGLCQVRDREAVCQCAPGFKSKSGTCNDIDECTTSPCHPSATCRNTPGSFQCLCAEGLVGDPFRSGCRKSGQCVTDSDCPATAACLAGLCKDPCGQPDVCGKNAECLTENHQPICRCAFQTTGDAKVECYTLECVDSQDCASNEQCLRNKCVDACHSPTACGLNSDCKAANHRATCTCRSGFTGNPTQGCVGVVFCTSESQCPKSQSCVGGLCVSNCLTSRDCLASQQCVSGKCRPACSGDSQCPDSMLCVNSMCVQEARCRADTDCSSDQSCLQGANGQLACQDPCAGAVLCGRNAACVVEDRKAVCRCKNGFFGNPQDDKTGCLRIECAKDSDCSDDKKCHQQRCKVACVVDNQCGLNTLCFSEQHTAVCKCQPGYDGDARAGCTPIDYCSQKPCAAGATCENTRGSFKCLCPTGTVGEPYNEGCQQPVECTSNGDCPPSAVCGRDLAGKPKCVNACAGIQCGPNAECQPRDHKGFCVCRQGFEGDAADVRLGCAPEPVFCKAQTQCPTNMYCYNGVCRAACASSAECPSAEACVKGQCVDPCTADASCGINAECRVENHQPVCSCPDGFTGEPIKECIRLPVACQKDDQCVGGGESRCQLGRCIPLCSADSQCALNEKCVDGSCVLTCRVENDCFLGHICLNGLCSVGCRANEDCTADEACVNSRCQNPCTSGAASVCGPNAQCAVADHRAQCSCPVGFLAYPSPNVACVREPTPCIDTKGCSSGFVCKNAVCRPLCSADGQCLSNERCDQGVCVPVCVQDGDCRSGEICSSGMCRDGCRADPDCPSSHACVANQCVSPCADPTACGTNAKCTALEHRATCSCDGGLVGDAKVACRYAPSICTRSADCQSGMKCVGAMCRPGCTK